MKSRNIIAESRELKSLKELRQAYPYSQAVAIKIARATGFPEKWKADLHGVFLSLLPAVLVFHMGLAAAGAGPVQLVFSMCLYVCALLIVLFIKGLSEGVVDDEIGLLKFLGGLSFVLVSVVLPVVVEIPGNSPIAAAWVGLIVAVIVTLISHYMLALNSGYLPEEKSQQECENTSDGESRQK